MGYTLVSTAVLAVFLSMTQVGAQSVASVGGPSPLPPASFKGQQYVDSRGCVFLKAGYGGQVTWVPRVGRDRKAMCGFPPTFGAKPAIEVATAAEMAVKPEVEPVAVAPVAKAAPRVVAAPPVVSVQVAPAKPVVPQVAVTPRAGYETAASGAGKGKIGCYSSAPVAELVRLRNGGTAVVCTRGDGSLTGWRPPIYPAGAGVGASLSEPVGFAHAGHAGQAAAYGSDQAYARADQDAIPKPPKGYVLAWTDDRLNPNRAKGTAQGWADQDQVWTRKVPATLVEDEPKTRKKARVAPVQVTVSAKNAPSGETGTVKSTKAAKGGAYIQVGTFGVPSNADGAASRLKGLGLPVARAKISSGGKAMQIVLAGPFASGAEARAALSMARGAGFGDAFIR